MPAEIDAAIDNISAVTSAEAASLKKKKLLVVVLLIGLLIAIVTQPESDDGSASIDNQPESAGKPASVAKSPDPAESDESRLDRLAQIRELKRIELDEILSLDLFMPESRQLRQRRPTVTQSVKAIYGNSSERSALVGQSIVRRGQPLPSGGKVLRVNLDGIQIGL